MAAVPDSLIAWLDAHYGSPRVDPEWLDGCYDWVTSTHSLDPVHHLPAIIEHVESQLLQSDLADSMTHGTGIPLALLNAPVGFLKGPVLVEITAITEIGHSALSLDAVRVARDERLAAGAAGVDGDEEADLDVDGEGPVPNYPRSMLRFELSDGASTLSAFEYRSIPDLTLGVTPLGYKLVLRDVIIRHGMAFLEPKCIEIKGHRTEDREGMQKADFARGLRQRMGRLEPEQPPLEAARSPLREISPPPSPPTLAADTHQHADDEDQPRRRRVPASSATSVVTSPYFSSSSSRREDMGLVLSPGRTGPIVADSDSENDVPVPRIPPGLEPSRRPIVPLKSSARKPQLAKDPPSDDYGDDMDIDDAFLAELQKAEEQSLAAAPPTGSRPRDVITIDDDDDDEEMEDKENVPAPQRHVRRRVVGGGDIIDISDSD